ncbi:sensor histidine kinase [Streptomyces shenzhenensis]|uniref:histidine kinase n=1 Tax=Streptomyces shenzhenensis TaxID=943815 RepID=A0A3M0IXL7_9ACTN|nr:histidine kinase [Streptomyces shenzhenensis]RMB87026.1 two-component sensor histidine kinase [Streptomyces shenzhenensis]
MTRPSSPSSGRPDHHRLLETLTDDPEQSVIVSVMARLAVWRRAERAHPRIRRWGVPALCTLAGVDSYLNPYNVGDEKLPLILAFTVPLLWRERRPMLVFALTTAASVVALPFGVLTGAEVARVVALFNVGRFCSPRQIMLAVGVTTVQLAAWAYVFWNGDQLEYATRPEVTTLIVMVAMASFAALGLMVRLADAYTIALKKQRAHEAQLAAAEERTRISREMHDILGHTLAVIVGLADGAAGLTEARPERGAQTLRIISSSGRDALAELRRLLAVIDHGPDNGTAKNHPPDAPLAPQPGLADLNPLLERVQAAGPTADLTIHGDLTSLTPGFQLTVYRIIQEALTNTVKYAAPTTSVRVSLTLRPDALHITVEDTGPSRTATASRTVSGGRGLVGMRQRAALYQGDVTAGPNTHGGWTVHARLIPRSAPVKPASTEGGTAPPLPENPA